MHNWQWKLQYCILDQLIIKKEKEEEKKKDKKLPLRDSADTRYGNFKSFPSSASNFNTEINPCSSPTYLHFVE